MTVSHPLPDDLIELIADRFRALSEPTRIRLLDRLRESEATVPELTELIGTTQQNVSKHLRILQRSESSPAESRATSLTTGSSTKACSARRLRQPPTAVRITPPARRRRARDARGRP